MASNAPFDAAAAIALDPDRLDVYRVAREFDALAARALPRRGCASLRDQLENIQVCILRLGPTLEVRHMGAEP